MASYIISAIVIALLALPLEVALELNLNRAPSLRIGVALAGLRVYYNANLMRQGGEYVLDLRRENSGRSRRSSVAQLMRSRPDLGRILPPARVAAIHMLRGVRTRRIGLHMRLGAGDAGLSALLCGLAGMVAAGLCAVTGVRPEIDVQPDYAHTTFLLSAQGMFSIRIGHIIGAVILAAVQFGKGELQKWRAQAETTR